MSGRGTDDGIKAPPTVPEGGTVEVEVKDGSTEIEVYVGAEKTPTRLPVDANGKVSVPVPARATGGTLLWIVTNEIPPSATLVEVVGTQG